MSDTYKTDVPCECGEYDLKIIRDLVGCMGDAPAYEDWGECPKCGNKFKPHEIDKRFVAY